MKDHDLVLQPQPGWLDSTILIRAWWVYAVMTPVESGDDLREDIPDVIFRRVLFLGFKLLDGFTQISSTAIFHVKMKVLAVPQMITMIVADDVWMLQRVEYREFGVQLFFLFILHAVVIDFFPAEDLVTL